jgi:hypothetical protein
LELPFLRLYIVREEVDM